jgi:hypothetical protein
MNTTPRTDEMLYRDAEVPAPESRRIKDWSDFARKLEKEHTALRECLKRAKYVLAMPGSPRLQAEALKECVAVLEATKFSYE